MWKIRDQSTNRYYELKIGLRLYCLPSFNIIAIIIPQRQVGGISVEIPISSRLVRTGSYCIFQCQNIGISSMENPYLAGKLLAGIDLKFEQCIFQYRNKDHSPDSSPTILFSPCHGTLQREDKLLPN